jgi:hypothetical protein
VNQTKTISFHIIYDSNGIDLAANVVILIIEIDWSIYIEQPHNNFIKTSFNLIPKKIQIQRIHNYNSGCPTPEKS